jgi:hypothetical protein
MEHYYGDILHATASSDEKYCERSASFALDNGGMSGTDGIFQTHNTDADAMWLTVKDPDSNCSIWFDFGEARQIGYMFVWNFNQAGCTGAGLRNVNIYYSCDFTSYSELRGTGYPYRFSQADGISAQPATNLDDGAHTPIDFGGITARYVKIVPNPQKNIGNWGDYIEGQHRYGLSEVRFYAYRPRIISGGYIPASAYSPDCSVQCSNLTNSFGLSDNDTKEALHTARAETMWVSDLQPFNRTLQFDLDGTYPLGEMWIWNYNEAGNIGAGIKNARIYYGINRTDWCELKGKGYPYQFACADGDEEQIATNLNDEYHSPVDFGGVQVRYIRLEVVGGPGNGTWGHCYGNENRFGLSKVRFYAAEGWCVEAERNWTGIFSRYNGWSGSDGIFMAPLDGVEAKQASAKTVVSFGDTLIGCSDPVTRRRKNFAMVNNSAVTFSGMEPDMAKPEFYIRYDAHGEPVSIVTVSKEKKYYYWLQDCIVTDGKFYAFTDNIADDPSGPEGFQFKLTGVDRVSFGIQGGKVDFEHAQTVPTPLFREVDGLYFGCSILPNGYESRLPYADGYIYIYGLMENGLVGKALTVARVLAGDFENFDKFEFFNGSGFCSDMGKTAPICEEGASEMSITPIDSDQYRGKYLLVYSSGNISSTVSCRIGETPWGPFGERIPIYATDESRRVALYGGKKIYTYSAKAHYHISKPGELLVSYNMNATAFESHLENCDIYRPRFIKIRRI